MMRLRQAMVASRAAVLAGCTRDRGIQTPVGGEASRRGEDLVVCDRDRTTSSPTTPAARRRIVIQDEFAVPAGTIASLEAGIPWGRDG